MGESGSGVRAGRGWTVLLAVLLVPLATAAARAAEPVADEQALMRAIEQEEADRVGRVVGLIGVDLGLPHGASGSFGALFYRMPASYDCRNLCRFQGLLLRAQPGLTAGRIGVGFARVYGGTGRHRRLLSPAHLGLSLTGSLLRTWRGAPVEPSVQTFAGIETGLTVVGVRFSAGLFRQVSGGATADPWLFSAGIGWGF